MSIGSIGDVAVRLEGVRTVLGDGLTALGQVEEQLEDYANTLAALGEGSSSGELQEATALAMSAREDLLQVFRMGSTADESVERFRRSLVGSGSGAAAAAPRAALVRTAAPAPPAPPKDKEVEAAVERAQAGDQAPVYAKPGSAEDRRRYVKIDVNREHKIGALCYVGPRDEDSTEIGTWVTKGSTREDGVPPLYVDRGTKREFPRNAVVPLDKLHEALSEFRSTGRRPRCVSWQESDPA
ncbi:Imm1 family immunity protein [Allokutzneria oryzae]|uniref:Imm1 family immunity protein n=1 Tax=Allokutzneria oryzae TaxID=1378989 RepID=A0ABV5ZPH6_9PSEU